jgi:hypothetical protein
MSEDVPMTTVRTVRSALKLILLSAVASGALAVSVSAAEKQETLVALADVPPEPTLLVFENPATGCRYIGAANPQTTHGWFRSVTVWQMDISTMICGQTRTPVAGHILPEQFGHAVVPGRPLIHAGDRAVLVLEEAANAQ